jgi:hypothetical protein
MLVKVMARPVLSIALGLALGAADVVTLRRFRYYCWT